MPYRRTFANTSRHKATSIYRHSHTKLNRYEMTEGPIFGKIILFILPLIATNLLQVFYNAADMMVVSLAEEKNAVGAIGITSAFINLIVNVFMGFATGTNVVISRNIGAKNDKNVSRGVHTSISVSLIFGIVSAALGQFISRPVLSLMGAKGNLLDLAVLYTRIYFIGVPFTAITNYIIAIFRAKGDTRTPLYILSITGLCNVLMNLFFVMVCGLSVEGVAIATVVASMISCIALCIKLSNDDTACKFSVKKLCIDFKLLKELLHIGIPAGIQGSLFSISNMLIQSSLLQINNALCSVDSAFQPVIKGNAAASNLEGFAYTTQNTVYQASITFTSQNIGAKKHERVYKVMRNCYLIGFLLSLIMSAGIILFNRPLLGLYGVSHAATGTLEKIAYQTAFKRFTYMMIPYFTITFMEVGCGVVRGLGKSLSSTVISLLGACLFRVVWILTIFRLYSTLDILYLSYPISWTLTGLIFLVFNLSTIKKMIKKRNSEEKEAEPEYVTENG